MFVNESTTIIFSGNSYSDLLMLIAIQFHANQTVSDQLSNLVVSVLGFKVNLLFLKVSFSTVDFRSLSHTKPTRR